MTSVDIIQTAAYSFAQGPNREVETRMWSGFYAQNSGRPVKISKGIEATFSTMLMYGDWLNLIASALTFRGIEDVVNPLSFALGIPENLFRVPDESIDSADGFFARLVAGFGPEPIRDVSEVSAKALWVIVDPHLLPTDTRQQIAAVLAGKSVLMVLPSQELVPSELISLSMTGQNEVYVSDAVAPFVQSTLEEAMLNKEADSFVVAGAGWRLPTTIIGVCDAVLQAAVGPEIISKNLQRQAVCRQFVSYVPFGPGYQSWCDFPDQWYGNQTTLKAAAMAYLAAYDFDTAPVQPDSLNPLNSRGDFTIAPYWQT